MEQQNISSYQTKQDSPFVFPITGNPIVQLAKKLAFPIAEKLLGLTECTEIYNRIAHSASPQEFVRAYLNEKKILLSIESHELKNILPVGGAVIVANHPFGALDGLLLQTLAYQVRTDIKIMGNYLLNRIPHLQPILVSVDPFTGKSKKYSNIKAIRQALDYLKQGKLLIIFPSGEVSHFSMKQRAIVDPPWSMGVAKLIRIAKVPVIPIYIDGQNSWIFQLAGLIHPRLRTLLLASELVGKENNTVKIRIGEAVNPERLVQHADDGEIINYLNNCTVHLKNDLFNKV